MRKVTREDTVTSVQVLEYHQGSVTELERMEIAGFSEEKAIEKASKVMKKKYPKRNVFCGEVSTGRFLYEMSAEDFMRVATKTEVK